MKTLLNGKYPISHVFHFTDIRNLPSIKVHGLLSWAELKRRGIVVPAPGGNEWSHEEDNRRQLDEYVHLCFFNQHPMEYVARKDQHIGPTTFLKIDADVLQSKEVRYTSGVANQSGSKILTYGEAITVLDLEVIYTRTDWRDPAVKVRMKAAKKYEILVPGSIPPNLITFP